MAINVNPFLDLDTHAAMRGAGMTSADRGLGSANRNPFPNISAGDWDPDAADAVIIRGRHDRHDRAAASPGLDRAA